MKRQFALFALAMLLLPPMARSIVAAAQGNQIDYGMTVEEILTSRSPAHTWVFSGRRGDVVTIQMDAIFDPDFTSLDTRLILQFEDGAILAEDDDGGEDTNSRIESFQLPEDGDYVIIARSFSGEEAGRYQLSLELVDRQSRRIEYLGQMGYGQRVEANLAPDVAAHVWEFMGAEGDEIAIAMNALTGELDPLLLLLRMSEAELEELFSLSEEELVELDVIAQERGVLLDGNDDREEDTNAYIPSAVLPADGPYVVVATSCCTAESSGPYELLLDVARVQPPAVPGGGQSQPPTTVPPRPPSRFPYVAVILLLGVIGVVMWRWVRPRTSPIPPKKSPVEPPPIPPDVGFKHGWGPARQSIDVRGKAMKFDIDIRFRLRMEQSAQYVDGYESSLIG